ncbi:MAG: DUF3597 domain-containing protein [Chloroflexota bacterium]
MNIFHTILQKLGIEKPVVAAPAVPAPSSAAKPDVAAHAPAASPVPAPAPAAKPASPDNPPMVYGSRPEAESYKAPAAIAVVDVLKKLDGLAKARPELDWKVSIVDMLKLLDIDSSFAARKELAEELGCPADFMADSARMNVWLHKTVLQKIADNGGNIPVSLLGK